MSEAAELQPTAPSIDYAETAPRENLRPFVRCLWRYRCLDPAPRTERIPGDGCPELVIHVAAPYREISVEGAETLQPHVLFAGQLTRPLALFSAWPVTALGVRFHPDGARSFFGRPMAEATDRRIALDDIHGPRARQLRERTCGAESPDEGLRIAEAYVDAALADAPLPDAGVRRATEALVRGEAAPLPPGLSERQFQRRFKDCVGVSPRELRSALRFRRVFEAIERDIGWTASALDAGYFDQPQMARDFRRYLGCTARDWARQKVGLASMLTQPAPESYKLTPAPGAMTRTRTQE